MNLISRGVRNAFRNSIRTFSIVVILGLSIGLSLTMLVAHQAVGEKITSVKASIGNTVSISPAGVRGFEGGGSALTQAQLAGVPKLAHVTKVSEGLSDRLTSTNTNLVSAIDAGALGQRFASNSGQSFTPRGGGPSLAAGGSSGATVSFTPPVTVNGTTDPTNLSSSFGGGTFKLKSGSMFSGTGSDKVAIVGTSLATKNNLKIGSTFTAYDNTITVVGIFDAGNTFSNNQVVMPLATVQALSSQADAITSATVTVDSIANVAGVTTAAQKALGSAADVTNDAERANEVVQPLQNIQSISLYSLLGAVIAGAVIILLTMVMIVRERRREIGVTKAIGGSNVHVVGQFTVEAMTLTTMAAIIGIALGVLASSPVTRLLVNNSSSSTMGPASGRAFGRGIGLVRNNVSAVQVAVGWDIILWGFAAALVIAILGSGLASLFIAKIRPAEVLRTE